MDELLLIRLGILALAAVGMLQALWLARRSPGPTVAFGPYLIEKRTWIRLVVGWNLIGLPLLAFFMFVVWNP